MRNVGIVAPIGRSDAIAYASSAAGYLQSLGIQVFCEDILVKHLTDCVPFSEQETNVDSILAFGGDGTILRGAQYAVRWDVPLLGINLGNMGFLAETEPLHLKEALDALLEGEYTEELRSMLSVSVAGFGHWLAMNDAVVTRGGYARLISVRAMVDEEQVGDYRSDGIIVATPTGSTGYSLSAGGPIISPRVNCMLITPVCAHSLQHRPAVVPGSATIRLELRSDDKMEAWLQVDGQGCTKLHAGDSVIIKRSQQSVRLIHIKDVHFFDIVHQKLSEWTQQ